MPANLPPPYKDAEARFRAAPTPEERERALREMIALLPKHKGTEKLHADLKHRLATLEEEGERAARSGKRRADPAHVRREGAGQWVLLGPPNAGKSSLLAALTAAHPAIGDYPFTTRAPQPGMVPFEDVQVQLVDAPPAAPGHTEGWLPNLVHGADGVLLVVSVADDDLEPDLAECLDVLRRARLWPAARALPPGDAPAVLRRPVLVAANKADLDPDGKALKDLVVLLEGPFVKLAVSASTGLHLQELRRRLFGLLRVVRAHSKVPGKKAEMDSPFALKLGSTVLDMARAVHKDFAEKLDFARVWSKDGTLDGLRVNRDHVLNDEDVVELHI